MRRILIIGNAGAGKTTFAGKLAEKTGLPLVHLDKIYWYGNWEHLSREEFDKALQTELEKEAWIIDGNYSRTLPQRLEYAQQVFYFDLPTAVCFWGSIKRVILNYGKCRPDMGGNCREGFDWGQWDLYRSILRFNRKHRARYYELLENKENVVIFRSRRQVKKYLKEVIC